MTTFQMGCNYVDNFIDNSTATFRAWGSIISDGMTAVGFTKTSDTGQIDWATATWPAINAYAGYEIRRLWDSADSAYPLYFKIEYGCVTTQNRISIRYTVGTGTNGAGTITGILYGPTPNYFNGSINQNVTVSMCRTRGVFWMALMTVATGYSKTIAFIRSQDASGNLGEDFAVLMAGNETTWAMNMNCFCVDRSTVTIRSTTNDFFSLPYGALPSAPSYRSIAAPVFCFPQLVTSDAVIMTRFGEFTPYTTVKANILGADRTYLILPYRDTNALTTGQPNYGYVWE